MTPSNNCYDELASYITQLGVADYLRWSDSQIGATGSSDGR